MLPTKRGENRPPGTDPLENAEYKKYTQRIKEDLTKKVRGNYERIVKKKSQKCGTGRKESHESILLRIREK